MIGLKRYTVRVVEHQPGWAALAAEACADIRQAAGDLIADIQHVGSTAVPQLPAKSILDLAAAVVTLDAIPALVPKLTGIGYIDRGDGGDHGDYLFVKESSPDIRTIHLHVVEHNGAQWHNYLRFRDLLRCNRGVREQYAELKRDLGKRFADDRKSYTAAKDDFIRRILFQPDHPLNLGVEQGRTSEDE